MHRFERIWQERLKENFRELGNQKVKELLHNVDLCEPGFSSNLLKKLKEEVGEVLAEETMMKVSCEYPVSELEDIRKEFLENNDLEKAHSMLQEKFDYFLSKILQLDDATIGEIHGRKWGLAGELRDRAITVSKLPKSGFLKEYFESEDKEERRRIYCHCPRIRDFIGKEDIDPVYCYCGAGFYRKVWQYITEKEVNVKMTKSIVSGDDHCQFIIEIEG